MQMGESAIPAISTSPGPALTAVLMTLAGMRASASCAKRSIECEGPSAS